VSSGATIIINIIVIIIIISACVESGHSRHRQRRATLLVQFAGSPPLNSGFQTMHTGTLEKEAIVPECQVAVSLLRQTCMS
jgi:hypothetical protein